MKPHPTLTSLCASTTLPLMGFIVSLVVAIQILLSGCGESPTGAEILKQKKAAAKKESEETPEAKEKRLKDVVQRLKDAVQKKRELDGPQGTGMWMMGEYVDEFKEKTGERYFTNTHRIEGTFSNSATEDSKLEVDLLVDLKGFHIQLYEYGNNLLKSSRYRVFKIIIQDKDGQRYDTAGVMNSGADRMGLASIITPIMKKGGPIKFLITDGELTKYFFTIRDPYSYENALRMLTEKK